MKIQRHCRLAKTVASATALPGNAMIHSSHRERKIKAIAEVLAIISDAHPELVRHRPRPVRETDEWMSESATEFCAALDRFAERAMEIKRQDRRPPGRAYLPARPYKGIPSAFARIPLHSNESIS